MAIDFVKRTISNSVRVKGISFSHNRKWMLASLHNGVVQLWDYEKSILLSNYHDHKGSVRAVAFHPTLNMFATGGDDQLIKVWDPTSMINMADKNPKPLFTLQGHTDYIRSVEFHTESPWIVSASDDQTIRIWNWQSRKCIAILTGHNHYVMSAKFGPFTSPYRDYVLSASLDQTLRVWNCTQLRKRSSATAVKSNQSTSSGSPRLFVPPDVVAKHVITGHNRGINYACWHPNGNYIASCSDDKELKIWQLDGNVYWEADAFLGHTGNVTSTVFAYGGDILLTCSEDRTIRIWDTVRKKCIYKSSPFSRYWVLAHQSGFHSKLFAVGHDNGFFTFQLESTDPSYSIYNRHLVFSCSGFVKIADLASLKSLVKTAASTLQKPSKDKLYNSNPLVKYVDIPSHTITTLKLHGSAAANIGTTIKYLSVSSSGNLLFSSKKDGVTIYNNIKLLGDIMKTPKLDILLTIPNTKKAVFSSRGRIIALSKNGDTLYIYNDIRDQPKTIMVSDLAIGNIQSIFSSVTTSILALVKNELMLIDCESSIIITKTKLQIDDETVLDISISTNGTYYAIMTEKTIFVYDTKILLFKAKSVNEDMIKSMHWVHGEDLIIYTTTTHTKYFLVSISDCGLIYQIPCPLYIVDSDMNANLLCFLDTNGKVKIVNVSLAEAKFKLATILGNTIEMLQLINSGALIGQSLLLFIRKMGLSSMALNYIKDPIARFYLAIESGDINDAANAATSINDISIWKTLSFNAIHAGKLIVAEKALLNATRLSNDTQFPELAHKLMFFYSTLGKRDQLMSLGDTALARGHAIISMFCSMLAGDDNGVMHKLRKSGNSFLTKQLDENANSSTNVRGFLFNRDLEDPIIDWPSSPVPEANDAANLAISLSKYDYDTVDSISSPIEYTDHDRQSLATDLITIEEDLENDTWSKDYIEKTESELSQDRYDGHSSQDDAVSNVNYLATGINPVISTRKNSDKVLDHVSIGDYIEAMKLLAYKKRIFYYNNLKNIFVYAHTHSHICFPIPGLEKHLLIYYPLPMLENQILARVKEQTNSIYDSMGSGNFADTIRFGREVLWALTLADDDSVHKRISSIVNYITSARLLLDSWTIRKKSDKDLTDDDMEKSLFYLCMVTRLDLRRSHKVNVIREVSSLAKKYGYIEDAIAFRKLLLTFSPPEHYRVKIEKDIEALTGSPLRRTTKRLSGYLPNVEYRLCHATYRPVYESRWSELIPCTYCNAYYSRDHITSSNYRCVVCELTDIKP